MSEPVIRLERVSNFYGSTRVLQEIDLSVEAGQIVGYIGPNGAGKSTTIKILTGLLPDFIGQATVLGYDVRTEAIDIKRRIGYVPELAALYDSLTPIEYLQFVGQLYSLEPAMVDRRSGDLLELFGLGHHVNDRMTTFSKGMRQKVLLTAGLFHNPDVIFLDEPLSGLDANAVVLVKEIIRQLADSGKTIFYSSHIMDVVERLSDRIVILNRGQVIANGTFAELQHLRESGSLEQIFTQMTGSDQQTGVAGSFIQAINS
jgi:ABC-2 type transport system ATP-binding protein